ncbi:MAG TPA: hypothetical protein EYN66_10215 [Myxococcales bacterium]|nr:hypothetical protein [Myxococcales bacterium]
MKFRRFFGPLVMVTSIGVLLRLPRVFNRWDEWALHYAGYLNQAVASLQAGDIGSLFSAWTGLHPPLYSMVHAVLNQIWPAPMLWLSFAALCSALAVFLVGHQRAPAAWIGALCLATDPIQVHYAAEINNYPMMVAWIALAWWGADRGDWRIIALAGAGGAWTHAMAGVAIGLLGLTRPNRLKILTSMLVVCAPLAFAGFELGLEAGNRNQPPLHVQASVLDALSRFGPFFLVLLPVLIRGCCRRVDIAVVWGGTLLFWAGSVVMGIAAPHQFPYALALGVPAVMAIVAGCDRTALVRLVVAVCLCRAIWIVHGESNAAHAIWKDQHQIRGIDRAIALSAPGDAIVLIRGLSEQDDDKRHTSPVLWRISPWEAMPAINVPSPTHRQGQPRSWRDRAIYTFDEPRSAVGSIPEARVFTVLYDSAAMNPERVPDHPRQDNWQPIGPDLLRIPTELKH